MNNLEIPLKRFYLALFVLGIYLFGVSPVFAASLSLDPSSGTFNRGCNFSININVDTEGTSTDGTDAILDYDSTRVSPLTITNGTIYPDYPGNFIDVQARKINISGLASVSVPFTGKGTLATVNFTVPQAAPTGLTQVTIEFDPNDKTKTTDSNVVERGTVVDVLNSVVNGSYTIGTGVCGTSQGQVGASATPSATPLSTPTNYIGSQSGGPKVLPPAGFTGPTLVLTIVGTALTILGILGLALL